MLQRASQGCVPGVSPTASVPETGRGRSRPDAGAAARMLADVKVIEPGTSTRLTPKDTERYVAELPYAFRGSRVFASVG